MGIQYTQYSIINGILETSRFTSGHLKGKNTCVSFYLMNQSHVKGIILPPTYPLDFMVQEP